MAVELVDTHCHLDFERFDEDRHEVIQRAIEAGVVRIVVPSLNLGTSQSIIKLAKDVPQVFAAVGVHPNDLHEADQIDETLAAITEIATDSKVVAIGEIGLDYYWKKAPSATQIEWLERQLEIASHLSLPVILHNRETTDDLFQALSKWVNSGLPEATRERPGVVHSFSGSLREAEMFIDLGFYIGFTGPLTYKKAHELREIAAHVSLDRVLIETDAPFLTPEPYRGKRNEPAYVRYIAKMLAEVRGIDLKEIASITTENANRLFNLGMARTRS